MGWEQMKEMQNSDQSIKEPVVTKSKILASPTAVNDNQNIAFVGFSPESSSWITDGEAQPQNTRLKSNKVTKTFKCAQCNYNFTEMSLLNNHLCIANVDNEEVNSKMATSPVLYQHKENDEISRVTEDTSLQHELREITSVVANHSVTSLECCSCDYKSNSIEEYRKHLVAHRSKPFQCERCNYAARTEKELSNHVKSNAHEKLIFQCQNCKFAFEKKTRLNMHIKSVHIDKSFKCSLCQQIFGKIRWLRAHFCPPLSIL